MEQTYSILVQWTQAYDEVGAARKKSNLSKGEDKIRL